ncbi:MAG: hypothetical protein QGI24_00630 [Kiritimatiellia bacterium]|nr:hypothetical protein [Kiritimatiellia bacterium]MDP6847265.1 hypothetical protein [Kiritimatiellia bacterium]
MRKHRVVTVVCLLVTLGVMTIGYAEDAEEIILKHVRTVPDIAKLAEVYKKSNPDAKDLDKSPEYWSWVAAAVLDNGDFAWSEQEARKKYYTYWVGILDGKCPDSDDFQIALAKVHYGVESDRDKYAERLDALFKKNQKEGDWKRILRWVKAYKNNWQKKQEYTAMIDYKSAGIEGIAQLVEVLTTELNEHYLAKRAFKKICETVPFEKLSNDEVRQLISIAAGKLEDTSTAGMLAGKLKLDTTSEEEKLKLAREFLKLDASMGEAIYAKLKDQGAAKMELLDYHQKEGNTTKALALVGELAKIDKYAKEMSLRYAQMLQASERYGEAIEAYKEANRPPDTLWNIVDCHLAMEDLEKAVAQLREIETNHKDLGKKAVYRIACLYTDAEDKKMAFHLWKEIIEKFPFSKEADRGRTELESIPPREPEEIILDF